MCLNRNIAINLKSIRIKQKLSQAALAEKASLSVSYISQLERGHRSPTLDTLEVLAEALGVDPLVILKDPKSTKIAA